MSDPSARTTVGMLGAAGSPQPLYVEGAPQAPTPRGLSPQDIQAAVRQLLDQAWNYGVTVLTVFREQATDDYLGRPMGNEQAGRSSFIATELRDTVKQILPSMMRMFFGGEQTAEFAPRKEGVQGVLEAQQATAAVNYIFREKNPGFLVLHSAFKDALIRRLGIVKYWWEPPNQTTETFTLTGVDDQQLQALNFDPDVVKATVVGTTQMPVPGAPSAPSPNGGPSDQPSGQSFYDVQVEHKIMARGRYKIEAVPPEEFVWSPNARDVGDALLVGHVCLKRRSDLTAMGFTDEDLLNVGTDTSMLPTREQIARQPERITIPDNSPQQETGRVRYAECYVYLDEDGDGIAEHRKIIALGEARKVVRDELYAGARPFALFSPDPEPHTVIGLSTSDDTRDLQKAASSVMRSLFDSLAFSVNNRMEAVETQVNLVDLMNPEIGGIIRVKQPGMLREIHHEFVGADALPMLDVLDHIKEKRTGLSKASLGLDADALQSSTAAAVAGTLAAAQEHLELIARFFGEGVRQLYGGLLKLVVQHEDRPMLVRLNGEYVPVDPRVWDADMDVTINIALGGGLKAERLQVLAQTAAAQTQVLTTLGPANPLCGFPEWRNTQAAILELAGRKDVEKFWKAIPPDYQPPPPPPPKPTPEELYAQVEQQKIAADTAKAQAQLQLETEKLRLAQAREEGRLQIELAKMDVEKARLQLQAQQQGFDQEKERAERELPADRMGINVSVQTAPLDPGQTATLLSGQGLTVGAPTTPLPNPEPAKPAPTPAPPVASR